ncbi:AAA family ATPase [Phycicoccus sp. HDW14]|uniref:ATP-dependent nuclease n=1 Tax=Phycicoccus sp. HDW14 TaxID=2714941 RepID=UPI00140E86C6|nr:AAA family ATPase [Phycicoccus sp. HDW14]QIM22023.1 AAA family ATPase [Phycicoccus sp. HDW14]
MLRSLKLRNFRSFGNFTVTFGDSAYLVGPNNAGKSTVLMGLRTADIALRFARQRSATVKAIDLGKGVPAYPVFLRDLPSLQQSIRHEFRNLEARLELTWKSGAKLTMVWPAEGDDGESPFFYLERLPGMYVSNPKSVRDNLPLLGVVPILSPVDTTELLLDEKYVKQNIAGRLSSRHFRNQLRILKAEGKLEDFLEWSSEWLDDIHIEGLDTHMGEKAAELDVYYTEAGGRTEKELAWAGDGIQIWLQLLYHLWRTSDRSTIILDEPEVYLHPDLQRRLVRLLEASDRQVILATHSAELISEVDARSIAIVDKKSPNARRVRKETDLQTLSDTLGTAFNVRLAKALRANVAFFVEGKDMSVLRQFATILGLQRISHERRVAVIKLEGYTHWGSVDPFRWLCDQLLPDAIKIAVLLDRDYRTLSTIESVEKSFAREGIASHVWRRKELESYVLNVDVISRVTGLDVPSVRSVLVEATEEYENEVFGQLLGELATTGRSSGLDPSTITATFKADFDTKWKSIDYRLGVCPPKGLIAALNRHLQDRKKRAVTARSLAAAHELSEIPREVVDFLRVVEDLN